MSLRLAETQERTSAAPVARHGVSWVAVHLQRWTRLLPVPLLTSVVMCATFRCIFAGTTHLCVVCATIMTMPSTTTICMLIARGEQMTTLKTCLTLVTVLIAMPLLTMCAILASATLVCATLYLATIVQRVYSDSCYGTRAIMCDPVLCWTRFDFPCQVGKEADLQVLSGCRAPGEVLRQ
eukprot:1470988-Amphidinium_carterae.1